MQYAEWVPTFDLFFFSYLFYSKYVDDDDSDDEEAARRMEVECVARSFRSIRNI